MSRAVLISIDGLNWDAMAACSGELPHLSLLMSAGLRIKRVLPVYPSLTMVNHATIATGVYPDRHGIPTNTRFDPAEVTRTWQGGESKDWYMDVRDLRAPTIWDRAKEQGRKVALLRWPVTIGADCEWLVPEVFQTGEKTPGEDWRLTLRKTDPEYLRFLQARIDFKRAPINHDEFDEWSSQAAVATLSELHPELLMVHLNSFDHACHGFGMFSPQSEEELKRADERVGRILRAAAGIGATCFVFGDHGFLNFDRRVQINSVLAREGWIRTEGTRIIAWEAIAHTNCAMAPIYLKEEARLEELLALLDHEAGDFFRVLRRKDLRRLRFPPGAACAIETFDGFSLGQNLNGPLVTAVGQVRGEHGYEPCDTRLQSMLIAAGPGIPVGLELDSARMVDLAPTFADFIGVEMPDTDGEALFGRGAPISLAKNVS